MKDSRKMASGMEEANFSTKTVDIMMGNGKRTRCMAGVNYSTKEASWPTREIGHTTSSMDMGKFIMTIQLSLKGDLIILTLIYLMTTGYFIRACSLMTRRKEEEEYS